MLEPNSATEEEGLFSPEASVIATELKGEMLAGRLRAAAHQHPALNSERCWTSNPVRAVP